MALVLKDRVKEQSTSTGTGSITLSGAYDGFQTFSAVVASGSTVYYCIHNTSSGVSTEWEVGIGTFTSPSTLSRDTVYESSNSNALVSFSAGTKEVFITYPAEKSVNLDASGNVSPLGTVSSGTWNGTTIGLGYGGTGQTTAQAAINTLAGATTSGQYLRGNGTNVVMSAIQAGDVPTLNQNTTGQAGSVANALTISSPLSGTSYNGASPVTVALASGYGDTQNPYASKTANYFLAAPNGIAGVPTFRAVVAADIPTLNQNTTGSAGSVANAVTFNNGGAGDASGTTYNGSAAKTVSYNTVGAPSTTGTNASGTWAINISGNAATATSATSASSATTAGSVTNALTFSNGGAGDASGSTYNGSAARTISYNSVGAPSTTGANASGTWNISISGNAATASNGGVTSVNGATGAVTVTTFASGTVMLFRQTSAPTGWTKDTTNFNDSALRVVTGAVSSGGSVGFTTAFASQAVSGSIGNTTDTGSVSISGGSVGATTLSTTQIPSHNHRMRYTDISNESRDLGYNANDAAQGWDLTGYDGLITSSTGGGGSHTHGFTAPTGSITMNAHNHTFTGTAINLEVKYCDVIFATKD